MTSIDGLVKKQREFFNSGRTLGVEFRLEALKRLQGLSLIHI